jgi:cytochrome c oxidase cbb3-type subunit III
VLAWGNASIRKALIALLALGAQVPSRGGAQPQAPATQAPPPVPAFLQGAYPQRETNPEAVARGRELYTVYGCSFCHGEDARGGSNGPSLLRSQLVQRDEKGETIASVVRNGVPNTPMVGFPLETNQLADLAEFLHSFPLDSRDPSRQRPETIVTGNARSGRRYFEEHCADCHSVTADLEDIASRYPDPFELQQHWLMPSPAPPIRVRVTTAGGTTTEGVLARIDEFVVSLTLDDGTPRSFARDGDVPRVVIDDPLAGHKDLLPVYTDPDIHNVTAYLVTLK